MIGLRGEPGVTLLVTFLSVLVACVALYRFRDRPVLLSFGEVHNNSGVAMIILLMTSLMVTLWHDRP